MWNLRKHEQVQRIEELRQELESSNVNLKELTENQKTSGQTTVGFKNVKLLE